MTVDLRLEHSQAIPEHDDLLEEGLERNALLLRLGAPRLEHELTARPAVTDPRLGETELLEEQLAQDFLELGTVHVEVHLRVGVDSPSRRLGARRATATSVASPARREWCGRGTAGAVGPAGRRRLEG